MSYLLELNIWMHCFIYYLWEWAIALHGKVLVHQGNWFSTCRKYKSKKVLYTQPALLVLSQLQSTLFRKLA